MKTVINDVIVYVTFLLRKVNGEYKMDRTCIKLHCMNIHDEKNVFENNDLCANMNNKYSTKGNKSCHGI